MRAVCRTVCENKGGLTASTCSTATLRIVRRSRGDIAKVYNIEFRNDVVFDVNHPLFAQIREDYETIQTFYKSNGFTKSEVGNMIQIRTKGQGGNSPKTYAFYFRRQFLISIFQ